jgi:hypothetical protein
VPVYRFDVPTVARQCTLLDTFVEVPYLESTVIRCGDELGIGGREPKGRQALGKQPGTQLDGMAYDKSRMGSLCACRILTLLKLGCQYFTIPS